MAMADIVVTLTPPPQEPGAVPTNIRRMLIKSVSLARLPMSRVLNPAVRVFTAWKKEARNLVCRGRSLSVLDHSRTKNSSVLPASRINVAVNVSRVCRLSFDRQCFENEHFCRISAMTINPIPPLIIRKQISRLISQLPPYRVKLSGNRENPALQNALTEWNAA